MDAKMWTAGDIRLGICDICNDYIVEGEAHTKLSQKTTYDPIIGMHIDCCPHIRCNGNYEDVWCMDCGADYNNGRLL